VVLSFIIFINWPFIQKKYYLYKAEKLGNCYFYYHNKIEFIASYEAKSVSRYPLVGADINTFQIVDIYCDTTDDCLNCAIWAKDSKNVFWKAEVLTDADPYTFVPLSMSGYSRDHIHVFYKAKNITVANPSEFKLLNDDFARDNQFVYFKDKPLTQVKHPDSFEILGHYCWRDASLVYLNGEPVPEADPKTFQLVDSKVYTGKFKFFVYKDKNNGYILDLNKDSYQRSIVKDSRKIFIISGIDSESFKALRYKYYTLDKNNVYFKDHIIENANPTKFKIIGQFYGIQDTVVYFEDSVLPQADYRTLEIKGHLLAVDANSGFYEGNIILGADIKNLKSLNDYYLTDGKNVFYKWHRIKEADPESFVIINEHLPHEAQDKNNYYRKGKIIKTVVKK